LKSVRFKRFCLILPGDSLKERIEQKKELNLPGGRFNSYQPLLEEVKPGAA
jgi:hypothetical protein